MTTPSCRLFPLICANGSWQMAADEILLEDAARGVASLRFYTWPEANLSLGYFQPHALRLTDPHLAPLPWVRRASGGAALVHHHEVTYALALPVTWQQGVGSWLCKMHSIIADALQQLGVTASLCPTGGEKKLGDVLCFLHHTPGDLLIGNCKVVGSAQRKQHQGIVQHGGILLAQSPHTPSLPGIAECTSRSLSPQEVAHTITETFSRHTNTTFINTDWTDQETTRIQEIQASRYQQPAWNEKR